MKLVAIATVALLPLVAASASIPKLKPDIVSFASGKKKLRGYVYKPPGNGPFPAVVYNHGSAPGRENDLAAETLGPLYASHGWVFFMPYRRGQGLSASAGPYIMDQVGTVLKKKGKKAGAAKLLELLMTDHLDDQLAALEWLKKESYVAPNRIAVAGNSLGGIEAVLGAEKGTYCAAIDASGAAESWDESETIREALKSAAKNAKAPIFFFQAGNDYDLDPSRALASAMQEAGKPAQVKIYPPFGKTARDGHSFAYKGASTWSNDVFAFLNLRCRK